MKTLKKTLAVVLSVLTITAALTGCAGKKSEGKLEKIQKAGKLVIATDAAWAPFEYIGADGEVTGSDIELGKYIAKALGVDFEVINVTFDTLSTYLANDECDLAIAAITITDERKEQMDFSDSYTTCEQYVVVMEDNNSVSTIEDLAGMKVGVHLGTTGDFLISDEIAGGVLAGTGAEAVQYKALPDASLALKNGELQAIVCDTLMAKNLAATNAGLKCFALTYTDGTTTDEHLGIAMKKGDEAFLAKINEIIAPIIADGTIDGWIVEHTALASNLD